MEYATETIIVMLKNEETGMLETELDTYEIKQNLEYITRIHAQKEDNEIYLYIELSTERGVEDWEYDAIYDYYEIEKYPENINIYELENCYNPTWVLKSKYEENKNLMENKIADILEIHVKELKEVYSIIKDKEDEYS